MRWLLLTLLLFSTCLISEAPERETRRKLMMTHNVSTTTTAKNYKNQANKSPDPNSDTDSPSKSEGSEEDGHDLFVKSPSISEQRHSSTGTNGQEKLDIVEMDYTLARRKPHIHN